MNRTHFILLVSIVCGILTGAGCSGPPSASPVAEETIVFPPPPAVPRIQYLTSFSSSTEFSGPQGAFNRFVFGEDTPLPIVKPYGITVHGSKIYICDTGLGGLEVLDLEDRSFRYFTPKGMGQLPFPVNCAVDDRGYLYVADGTRKQVVIFDSNLSYIDAFSLEKNAKPTDVEVNGSMVFAAALDDHSIHVFDRNSLEFTGKIPAGDDPEQPPLYQPANMCLNDSLIMVSDIGGCNVTLFDPGGKSVLSFGGPGRGFGEFTRPKGIACDRNGNIYVVDAAFENIQVFNPDGDLLMSFGGTYTGPGGMWLPAGVTIDYNNLEYFEKYVHKDFRLKYLVYVTNQYGPDRVSVYGFIGPDDPSKQE